MPLKLTKRGKIWHYSGTVAGRRLRGTTGATDKAIAQRIAAETEAAEWKRHLDGPGAHVTFAQASIAYRQAEKPDRFLEKIEDHWQDTPIREITPGAIRQSAMTLYPNATGATRNRQVIVPTQAIINFAAELEWCAPIKVKRFPVNAKEKVPASREWVEAFAAQAEADHLPHLAALCLFMFGTAARIGEAVRLTWGDVDFISRSAVVRIRKPKPWNRTAHLPQPVVVALANIQSNRNPEELVFGYAGRGSVKDAWNNTITRAGIERLTPHSCRHGFATTMLRAGVDVKTVAKAGGWKDAATVLKTYAHALEDPTVSDAVFGTEVTHAESVAHVTIDNQRKNRA
ncbi:tyrosine-type recombinase/integrase [Tranquillimonas alkanivorans]|uniref:Site-specific recombinase XerD n=1 Tax=Tranquillimonas alkanivorans TaxID=441119 RepID=A0A1I5L1L7_9RHOB|nr:site-specific integrase [Tranquillimonas alkanivorans]SFO91230.1 Site-specific recombinase XerD [Tranquillimonas alkanivorans]